MSSASSRFRAIALPSLAVGAVLSLSACGALQSLTGNNVFDLEVGDCFVEEEMDSALGGEEISNVPLVDCEEPHDAEIYHTHEVEGDDFPGQEAIEADAEEACLGSAFSEFIGVDYMESEIYAYMMSPTEDTWTEMDDREIVCYVVVDEEMTGSLEGANR